MRQNKTRLSLALITLIIGIAAVYADSWTNQPSHQTLYADTITSKTDASSVNIADSQGLFVTGDVTTLGKVGIGTTGPGLTLHVKSGSTGGAPASSGIIPTGRARLDDATNIALDFGAIQSSPYPAWIQAHDSTNQATNYPLALNPNGGNVGVGTTDPGYKLEVGGNIGFKNNLLFTSSNAIIAPSTVDGSDIAYLSLAGGGAEAASRGGHIILSGNEYSNANDAGNIEVGIGNTALARLRVRRTDGQDAFTVRGDTGNVGIGTTGPGATLDVQSVGGNLAKWTATSGTNYVYEDFVNTGGHFYIGRENSVGNSVLTNGLAYAAVLNNGGSNALQFGTGNTARMTIDSGGNVGIGTTNPFKILEVHSGTDKNIIFRPGSELVPGWTGLGLQSINDAHNTAGDFVIQGSRVLLSGSGNNDLVVAPSGNVGIGTTGPQSSLHLAISGSGGPGGNPSSLQIPSDSPIVTRNAANTGGIAIIKATNAGVITVGDQSAVTDVIFDTTSGEPMRIKNGNVGIGTTNPTSKLHVIGKITATGGIDPPYVSFSDESHESIRQYSKNVEKHEAVMEFWNGKAHRKEIYAVAEDKFYTINGELIKE